MSEIVFVDRYSATGTPYPDPETVCTGQCEGMGCYPVHKRRPSDTCYVAEEPSGADQLLWQHEHDKHCNVRGVMQGLWDHKEWWYWKSIGRDVWSLLKGKGYCDGWHFVKCPDCGGTGKR